MATAGYTSIGANTETAGTASTGPNPTGLLVTFPSVSTVSKITAYVRGTVGTTSTTCKLYAGSAGSRGALVSTSTSASVTTSFAWVDFVFSSPVAVSATTYWVQFDSAGGDGPGTNVDEIKYDTGGASNTSYSLDDFGVPGYGTRQYSMYATYTITLLAGVLTNVSSMTNVTSLKF